MTIDEARKNAEEGRGHYWGWQYDPGDLDIVVDGRLSADDLEALAIMMRDDQARAARQEGADGG